MKALLKFTTGFIVPVTVLMAAFTATGIALDSPAAYVIMGGFMAVKLLVQHIVVEPASASYIKANREIEYRAYSAVGYTLLALGTLCLFFLATT